MYIVFNAGGNDRNFHANYILYFGSSKHVSGGIICITPVCRNLLPFDINDRYF